MDPISKLAYRHLRSFRSESGKGLHGLYVGLVSMIYDWRATGRHNKGHHGPLVSRLGRCEWCGRTA